MRSYLALTKILLKTGINMPQSASRRRKTSNKFSPYLLYLFIFLCFLPMMGMLYGFGRGLFTALFPAGLEILGIQVITYAGSFVVLVFALPYVLSVFFLSTDLETLLPLPLKPWQIVAAKFTAIAVYEYYFILLMVAPMLAGYGIAAHAGAIFWFQSVLLLLLLPVTPLVYASLLAMLMMRLFKNLKNKESLTTVGSLVMIFLIIIGSNLLSSSGADSQQLAATLTANQTLLGKINYIFPNLPLLQQAMATDGLLWMVAYLLSVAVFVGVFLLIAEKLYFSGVMNLRESTRSGKHLTLRARRAASFERSPVKSYLVKELRSLVRTPTYLMNCLMLPFLLPLFMLIPLLLSFWKMPEENLYGITQTIAYVAPDTLMALGLLIVYGVSVMLAGSNYTITTTISREGKGFLFMKYIPMPYSEQLRAKVLSGYLTSLAAVLPYTLLITIFLVVWGHTNFFTIPLGLIIAALTCLWVSYLQLWSDLRNPKLDWENEQAAVKENFGAFFAMIVVYSLGVAIGAAAFFSYQLIPRYIYFLVAAFCLLSAGLCYLLQQKIFRYGVKRLEELE